MTPHDLKEEATTRVVKNWKTTLLSIIIIIVCGILVYAEKVDFETGILIGVPTLIGGLTIKDNQLGL
jgi:hypothetical protein